MTATPCPRCNFVQESGTECQRCGVLFARVRPAAAAARPRELRAPVASRPAAPLRPARSTVSGWRIAFRILRWCSLAATLTVLFLILRPKAAPEVASDPEARARAGAKLARMGAPDVRGIPQSVELDEAELNAWLAESLALGASPQAGADRDVEAMRSNVRDVRIQLVEDRLRAWVLFDLHGKDMTLTFEGRLGIREHRLHIEATAAWLGSLPVPRAALERGVARALEDPRNAANLRLPPDIADVRIEDGRLVLIPAVGTGHAPTPSGTPQSFAPAGPDATQTAPEVPAEAPEQPEAEATPVATPEPTREETDSGSSRNTEQY